MLCFNAVSLHSLAILGKISKNLSIAGRPCEIRTKFSNRHTTQVSLIHDSHRKARYCLARQSQGLVMWAVRWFRSVSGCGC